MVFALEQLAVDVHGAELVHEHGESQVRAVLEQVSEQRGLARAKEAGDKEERQLRFWGVSVAEQPVFERKRHVLHCASRGLCELFALSSRKF